MVNGKGERYGLGRNGRGCARRRVRYRGRDLRYENVFRIKGRENRVTTKKKGDTGRYRMGTRRIDTNICRNSEVSDIMNWKGKDCGGLCISKILLDFWYGFRAILKFGVRVFSIREAQKRRRGGRSGRKKSRYGGKGEQGMDRVGFINPVLAKTLNSARGRRGLGEIDVGREVVVGVSVRIEKGLDTGIGVVVERE